MHKLLARQLRAATPKDGEGPNVDALIAIIDQAYDEFDRERRLNDRAGKLMEEELKAANEQARREHGAVLATILDSASDGMLVTGDGGSIETANGAAESHFGAARGGLAGLGIGTLMGSAAEAIAKRGASGLPGDYQEGVGRALNGTNFPIEFTVSRLGLSVSPRFLWIVRNISERIQSQRELMDSRMRFQDFAEASSDCFWEIDPSLTRVEVHSSTDPNLATLVSTILTPSQDGRVPEGVAVDAWTSLRRYLSARHHFRIPLMSFDNKGQGMHLSLSGKPVFDLDGHFRGYRGTARDMTREVAAQAAAQRAERRMIEAMDAAPNAIALLDAEFKFVAGNTALRNLGLGYAEELWPGRPFASFMANVIPTESKEDAEARVNEVLRDLIGAGTVKEINLDGLWLLAEARPLSDGGAVVTMSDVTSLKERERELASARRAAESASHLKSQFLATMSHELRTPLNAILGFSEVIRDQVFGATPESWAKYAQYAASIHTSGGHLLSLISEILDLSKIEAGSYVLEVETLDLREIVNEATTIISPAARRSGVTVQASLPEGPVWLAGEERAMRQITLNLLSNAVKFTPEGGSVRAKVAVAGNQIELEVTDTGVGIAKDHIESVFEPFRQVDASIRRRHEGTGLGLAITKRLVELHGGNITLESELSVGTTVKIRLPALKSSAALQPSEAA